MERILGLDLGVGSIGWALIEKEDTGNRIVDMGVRVVPLTSDDEKEFSQGNAITKNQKRRIKRGIRRGQDRFQQRRGFLERLLKKHHMFPDQALLKADKLELFGLRDKAVKEKVSLGELGRIFLHLNQRRGYKSNRKANTEENDKSEYLLAIAERQRVIQEKELTIGQYFYQELLNNRHFRVKQEVFSREAYIAEFNKIWNKQSTYYPEILSEELQEALRDNILYFQRPLRSQKSLVNFCQFENIELKETKENKILIRKVGPRAAAKTNPLSESCRIWESINNITIYDQTGERQTISLERKLELFSELQSKKEIKVNGILKILGFPAKQGFYADQKTEKTGLKGDELLINLKKILKDLPGAEDLLKLDLALVEVTRAARSTGDIMEFPEIDKEIEKTSYYQLWHCLYSIEDEGQLLRTLENRFGIPYELGKECAAMDLHKQGYTNKSIKAIRRILPHLMNGQVYSEACSSAGYDHSNSLTKWEKDTRELVQKLDLLKKGELRQPIVEKILNQMINIVNAIISEYGNPDKIVIELGRELKQSKEERNRTYSRNNKQEKVNKDHVKKLEEYGLRSSRKQIEKSKLFEELAEGAAKNTAICLYCGQPISYAAAMNGVEVEVEHIIPKSRLFDDSFMNKTLVHTKCNANKGNLTAFDYMQSQSEELFNSYITRVNGLVESGKLLSSKRAKLLMSASQIPDDFISRQLRETQYISRKAMEILLPVTRDIYPTTGSVTAYLRHTWGYDDILMNCHMDRYRQAGLTTFKDTQSGRKELIPDWDKRKDHRHHAVDALVCASTTRSIIQRLNKMNKYVDLIDKDSNDPLARNLKVLLSDQRMFSTAEVQERVKVVCVSFKPGKRAAVKGKRRYRGEIIQQDVIIPRGPLSEETVYGKIMVMQKRVPVKQLFDNPDMIIKEYIRKAVKQRLHECGGDIRKAKSSISKTPILLEKHGNIPLEFATIWNEEYVVRYPLNDQFNKADKIVDPAIKEIVLQRLQKHGNDPKKAFRNLNEDPVFLDENNGITIRSVRCFTGLGNLKPVHKSKNGLTGAFDDTDPEAKDVDYVKPGNNHHVSVFEDENGKLYATMTTFWEATERVRQGLPVINKEHEAGYRFLFSLSQNEVFEYLEGTDRPVQERLYRVQKMSLNKFGDLNIWFRQQYETELDDSQNSKLLMKYINTRTVKHLREFNKVRVNIMGKIT